MLRVGVFGAAKTSWCRNAALLAALGSSRAPQVQTWVQQRFVHRCWEGRRALGSCAAGSGGCECMLCLFHVSPRSPALLLDATLESTPPEEGSVSSSCFSDLGCCYRIDGSWLLSAFHLMLSVIPLVWLCSPRAPSLRSVLCSCAFLAPQQGLGGSQAEAAQRKAPSPCALAVSSFLTWISSCFSAPAIRKLSVRSCRKSWIKSWR